MGKGNKPDSGIESKGLANESKTARINCNQETQVTNVDGRNSTSVVKANLTSEEKERSWLSFSQKRSPQGRSPATRAREDNKGETEVVAPYEGLASGRNLPNKRKTTTTA